MRTERGHPNEGDRSFMTLMIYLDGDELKGGETNFLNPSDHISSASTVRVTSVSPSAGVALFFEHELLHEGARVRQGVKHAIRTDVMFRRYTPTARQQEAAREAQPTGDAGTQPRIVSSSVSEKRNVEVERGVVLKACMHASVVCETMGVVLHTTGTPMGRKIVY